MNLELICSKMHIVGYELHKVLLSSHVLEIRVNSNIK